MEPYPLPQDDPNPWRRMVARGAHLQWLLRVINVDTGEVTQEVRFKTSMDLVIEWMHRICSNNDTYSYDLTDMHFNYWLNHGNPDPNLFLDQVQDLLTTGLRAEAHLIGAAPPARPPPVTDEALEARLGVELAEPEQPPPPSTPLSHPWGHEGFPTRPTDADMNGLADFWAEHPDQPPPGWAPATEAGNPWIAPAPAPAPRPVSANPPGSIRTERASTSRYEPYPPKKAKQPRKRASRKKKVNVADDPPSDTGSAPIKAPRRTAATSPNPFICPVPGCDSKFVTRWGMMKHLTSKHPGYSNPV